MSYKNATWFSCIPVWRGFLGELFCVIMWMSLGCKPWTAACAATLGQDWTHTSASVQHVAVTFNPINLMSLCLYMPSKVIWILETNIFCHVWLSYSVPDFGIFSGPISDFPPHSSCPEPRDPEVLYTIAAADNLFSFKYPFPSLCCPPPEMLSLQW